LNELSLLKRVLFLILAVAGPFAAVVGGAALLSRQVGGEALAEAAPAQQFRNPGEEIEHRFQTTVQPFLVQHCYHCHGDGKSKGELTLDRFKTLSLVQDEEKVWRHVADNLRQKVMPPDNRPQPKPEEVEAVAKWIDDALAWCDCTGPRDPGRIAVRRLNRTEYNNTIRDLVGVDFEPAKDFPADDTGYGFDNIADVLTMSPLLAEKYLAAAEQVLDKAIDTTDPLQTKTAGYNSGDLQANGEGNSNGDLTKDGEAFVEHDFVSDGIYVVRVRAAQQKFGDEPARMELRLGDQTVQTFDVNHQRGDRNAPMFEVRLDVNAGKRRLAAAYVNNKVDNNNPDPKLRGDRNLYVRRVEVEGPLYPPPPVRPESHRRIFFCSPGENGLSEEQAARQIVERFATRAFRRPAAVEDVEQLISLYKMARAEGDRFEDGVELALTAALVSPHFLYRVEVDPPGSDGRVYAISDYELATRLSYFLWSSMPDEELFSLAAAKKLKEPGALEAQVKRMLAHPKAAALVSNFTGQWLELRNLDRATPDPKQFPTFDESLKTAMRREAEAFFENLIREDRSVLEMLDADYTFMNERLAKHYGVDGVQGDAFRKVELKPEMKRGGVLGMAGVLTVTAMPSRTSPVKRGKFVLEQVLGTPPPPAPADVPALDEEQKAITTASLRERLEQHREDPNCAICHIRMDPIGFSLENFNAVGQWRDMDGAFKIDPSGKLPEGQAIDGPAGLKKVLLGQKNDFTRCLVEKMATYALGRGLGRADKCTVRDIVESAENNGYRISSIILGIVKSEPFQKRKGKESPAPAQARAEEGRTP
jgi:mono/diheme cytochrome c family protein